MCGRRCLCAIVLVLFLAAPGHLKAAPVGSGFTYQGQLKNDGTPVTGQCDLLFSLWDAAGTGSPPAGGNLIGSNQAVGNVSVVDGLFTVEMNAAGEFGANAFNGEARWLQISVRQPVGSGRYTTLSPRQKITGTPYALFATAPWKLSGTNLCYTGGNVGIGTSAPSVGLEVHGGLMVDTQYGVLGLIYGPTGNGWRWALAASGATLELDECPAGGSAAPRMVVTAGGKVGIGSNSPDAPLEVRAAQAWQQLISTTASFGSVLQLRNMVTTPAYYGAINFADSAGNVPGQLGYVGANAMTFRTNNAERMRIDSSGRVGIGTSSPVQALDVNGTARVKVLEITGADLAERFEFSETAEPGMVVAIDARNPGKLCLARGAYNKCVAGVISGANSLRAGVVLAKDAEAHDTHQSAVALSGRVWVRCDATTGAIAPGDLLTTADRAGHAMAVRDHAKAQGAIIGKAMTSLDEGKTDLVLVLVTLQ